MAGIPGTRAARAALRRIGLPEVVLGAALLVDLLIIGTSSVDGAGPRWVDLLLLPGVLGMTGCALWARKQPVSAAFAGFAVLVGSTVLIRTVGAPPYSALLSNISFAETVAGVELVYLCVRWAYPGVAVAATSSLVVAALGAAFGRVDDKALSGADLNRTVPVGILLLIVSVAAGWYLRSATAPKQRGAVAELLRTQWPLIGLLALPLFAEVYSTTGAGIKSIPLLVCSVAAAVLAVLSARTPLRAGFAGAGVLLLSAVLAIGLRVPTEYALPGGIPPTQIAAGLILAVYLLRIAPLVKAWTAIAALSVAVAIGAVLNAPGGPFPGADAIRILFLGAAVLLGIAAATGLHLRSRDTQRAQLIRTAVADAQTGERMALARELHDVVAHHVTGIVVQAQAAKMIAANDPGVAGEALDKIEHAGNEALTAMRRLVGSMRADAAGPRASEQASTDLSADLQALVSGWDGGARVDTDLDLPADLPQEVARSALRLAQEALTNIGKHAVGVRQVTVSARVASGELHIRVSDDGEGSESRPAGGSGGYGLVGMRERVELLGGTLSAGAAAGGGWVVAACLPLEVSNEGET